MSALEFQISDTPEYATNRFVRWALVPLAGILTLVLVVFYGLNTTVKVDGDSMYPALHNGDRVLRTRGLDSPMRGDLISFSTSDDGDRSDGLVKRVIAVPGDTVEIDADVAIVNGVAEDASKLVILSERTVTLAPLTVPEGSVYVLGDNRAISLDSRFIGPISIASIRGRITFAFWPPERIGRVD